MSFWRKKPVVIEAIQWTGDNLNYIRAFTMRHGSGQDWPPEIFTLEGPLNAIVGDWIIKGSRGEFYPCKSDIFFQTYELAGEKKCQTNS